MMVVLAVFDADLSLVSKFGSSASVVLKAITSAADGNKAAAEPSTGIFTDETAHSGEGLDTWRRPTDDDSA